MKEEFRGVVGGSRGSHENRVCGLRSAQFLQGYTTPASVNQVEGEMETRFMQGLAFTVQGKKWHASDAGFLES